MPMENSAVDNWLQVHRDLISKELAFSAIALKAANGEVSMEELDRVRSELIALRNLCATVYDRTFKPSSSPTSH